MSVRKRCDEFGKAFAGSQRQIQYYVNEQPAILNRAIGEAFGRDMPARWVSPLMEERYKEYSDRSFLQVLGLGQYHVELRNFWPNGGPVWDALALVGPSQDVLLVEAKSHIPEIYAGKCAATAAESIRLINLSVSRTTKWFGVNPSINWLGRHSYVMDRSQREGYLYQSANRLAHLYFLREILGLKAWLANVCFTGDPHSPTSLQVWKSAIAHAKRSLGIGESPFVREVFLPASCATVHIGDMDSQMLNG
jgi:hypothetical protein